ncbi:MAG TPA: CoA pyrophosphatase [Ohtaekwangia sp.]|uniref:NUDIX hydrolase n=1 Tax=Ohtaekwangia sp. TaxID=2066019 RepID=UPI002F93B685
MSFDELKQKIAERLLKELPGPLAHEPMRAVPVGRVIPKFEHKLPPRPGSVLILLYEDDGIVKFPLIKRTEYIGAHSGQISLPGGKAETGEDVIQTALREGNEEVGIDIAQVKVLGRLSNFFVIPSNFIVTPIVATMERPAFKADPHEVARILSCNLFDLIKEEAVLQKEIMAAGQYRMMAPYFDIEGEIVWGATAMMLNELRLVVRELEY